mmetsp:Transcript_5802/g.16282  ORF Transcript_5802/g.16282 Transcript_5802/m.16282 type:complete len:246 (+) Transcript_5802:490-1227(+)
MRLDATCRWAVAHCIVAFFRLGDDYHYYYPKSIVVVVRQSTASTPPLEPECATLPIAQWPCPLAATPVRLGRATWRNPFWDGDCCSNDQRPSCHALRRANPTAVPTGVVIFPRAVGPWSRGRPGPPSRIEWRPRQFGRLVGRRSIVVPVPSLVVVVVGETSRRLRRQYWFLPSLLPPKRIAHTLDRPASTPRECDPAPVRRVERPATILPGCDGFEAPSTATLGRSRRRSVPSGCESRGGVAEEW